MFNNNILTSTVADNLFLLKGEEILYPEYDVIDNKIIIYPPVDDVTSGYIDDSYYELHIGTGMKSFGGNSMLNERIILLYFMDKYIEYID